MACSAAPVLDKLTRTSKNLVERKTVDPNGMSRMVRAQRADYVQIDEADLMYLRGQENGIKSIRQIFFPNMPLGPSRYITCTKDVIATTMKKLNRAMDAMR